TTSTDSGYARAVNRARRARTGRGRGAVASRVTTIALVLLAVACRGKASRDECAEMLDKYLDMVIAQEPELAALPPDQAAAAREMKRVVRKSEPSYLRV